MSVEEQFRDSKGTHFGLKLRWTCFERGEYLERMYLLVGVAMLLWTSIGRAIEKEKPKVRLKCYCRHRARLSLLRIGILFWRKFTEGLKLTTKFIKENLPLPKVRIFSWLLKFNKSDKRSVLSTDRLSLLNRQVSAPKANTPKDL